MRCQAGNLQARNVQVLQAVSVSPMDARTWSMLPTDNPSTVANMLGLARPKSATEAAEVIMHTVTNVIAAKLSVSWMDARTGSWLPTDSPATVSRMKGFAGLKGVRGE